MLVYHHPKSILYYSLGKILVTATRILYDYRDDTKNQENIRLASEQLKQGSIIAYFNHTSLSDGLLTVTFLLDNLGLYIRRFGGPASQRHFDFSRDPLNAFIMRLGRFFGIELFPVVQHYDSSYSREVKKRNLENFYENMKNILSQPGGMVFIAPEGTRSPDGKLQKGQRGIEDLKGNNIKYFPFALIPESGSNRGYNFGKRFDIIAGKPFSITDTKNGITYTDMIMLKLAELLPKERRGYYRNYP